MFSNGLTELLTEVIKSWQVLAVTIVLIIYMYLVTYAARTHHRPRSVSKSKPKKVKAPPKEVVVKEESDDETDSEEEMV